MGYYLYIHGIEPITDEKKLQLMAVRKACEEAGISEPDGVSKVLDSDEMCERGKIVKIDVEDITESNGDFCQYINIRQLPSRIEWIRIWHSC